DLVDRTFFALRRLRHGRAVDETCVVRDELSEDLRLVPLADGQLLDQVIAEETEERQLGLSVRRFGAVADGYGEEAPTRRTLVVPVRDFGLDVGLILVVVVETLRRGRRVERLIVKKDLVGILIVREWPLRRRRRDNVRGIISLVYSASLI